MSPGAPNAGWPSWLEHAAQPVRRCRTCIRISRRRIGQPFGCLLEEGSSLLLFTRFRVRLAMSDEQVVQTSVGILEEVLAVGRFGERNDELLEVFDRLTVCFFRVRVVANVLQIESCPAVCVAELRLMALSLGKVFHKLLKKEHLPLAG